jgi:hypothetical protein
MSTLRPALAAALLAGGVVTALASPASATDVSSEAQLRAAFANPVETSIVLMSDVELLDCVAGELLRAPASAPLTISGRFTIRQTCPGARVISGGANPNGGLTVDRATITGGNLSAAVSATGGGIFWNGDVDLVGATVVANTATSPSGALGGGVFATGDLDVVGSSITQNVAGTSGTFGGMGGAFVANGTARITDSTVANNTATGGSSFGGTGGASFGNGTIVVSRSTFAGNVAESGGGGASGGNGGAIVTNSAVTIASSTFTANVAVGANSSNGGVGAAGDLTIVYSTFVANSAATGANIQALASPTFSDDTIFATVLAAPQGGGGNCGTGSAAVSAGYNLATDASCNLTATGDRQSQPDPGLGGLAANGGPTATMLPSATSPLLDAIPTTSCQAGPAAGIAADQRGVARPQGAGCDIGAVEVVVTAPPSTTTTTAPAPTTTAPGAAPRSPAATPVSVTPRFAG